MKSEYQTPNPDPHKIIKGRNIGSSAYLSQHRVPNIWKAVIIAAIHKKTSPSDAANYRPIAPLSIVQKVLEKNYTQIYVQLSSWWRF